MKTELTTKIEAFRKELLKIMPGYNWTIHKPYWKNPAYLEATGIQTSGFNRMSTLGVVRRENEFGAAEYEVKSSGYGAKAPWIASCTDTTLARALRHLQDIYEAKASQYRYAALRLKEGRRQA